MNRKVIKIRYESGVLCLPLNDNGNLRLKLLKQYFPNAQALTYTNNGQICGLDVVLDDIIINPAVDYYNVHIVEDASRQNIITEKKKKRIVHDILGRIEKKKKQNPHSETSINSKIIDPEKSLKFLNIMKSIHIGWLHKTSAAGKYMQIKKPSVGSIQLKLQLSCHYSVDDIKTLAMNEFLAKCKSTSLENLMLTSFEHLNVFLGTFNGTIVSSFSKDDKDCGFWHYFKQQKLPPSRIHLYLLTSPKDESSSNINMEVKRSRVLTEKSFLENKKENLSITPHTDTKQSVLITESPLHVQNAVSMPQSSNGTSKILDDIKFLYEYIRESKYSKDLSIFHLEKMDLHSSELENINFTSIEEFEPLNFGFRISSIIMDNKVLLNILMDENFKREYTFPSAEIINDNRHYIIYDVNEFNGIYDGKYGVGVITNCIDTCQLWFTWYEDNKVVKAGKFFYWLSDVKENSTYKCVINCGFNSSPITTNDYKTTTKSSSLFCTSDKTSTDVLPNVNIIQKSSGDISIPLIQRKEIEIFKTLLGAGAQGKVRKTR